MPSRRCIAAGELSKALAALTAAVDVTEPLCTAYTRSVLLVAQVFLLARRLDASLTSVLGVVRTMPVPYKASDGVLIVVSILPAGTLRRQKPSVLIVANVVSRTHRLDCMS